MGFLEGIFGGENRETRIDPELAEVKRLEADIKRVEGDIKRISAIPEFERSEDERAMITFCQHRLGLLRGLIEEKKRV